jgi:hypothetical protein
MGERIGRIGRIRTDFFWIQLYGFQANKKKIRSDLPNPPNPFSHRISIFQNKTQFTNHLNTINYE